MILNGFVLPLLPQPLADTIRTYILHPHSAFQIYGNQALILAQRGYYETLEPLWQRALDTAVNSSEGGGTLVAMLPLITFSVAAVMVVSFVMRLVSWWTRILSRIAFWAVVAVLLLAAWERGPLQSARDCVVVVGKIVGYGAAVRDIWVREYQHYEEQTRSSARAHHTRR